MTPFLTLRVTKPLHYERQFQNDLLRIPRLFRVYLRDKERVKNHIRSGSPTGYHTSNIVPVYLTSRLELYNLIHRVDRYFLQIVAYRRVRYGCRDLKPSHIGAAVWRWPYRDWIHNDQGI